MSPDFGARAAAIERGGYPPAAVPIELELDHQSTLLIVRLRPYSCAKLPVAGVEMFDSGKRRAMKPGQVFPINRILIHALQTYRHRPAIARDMRHSRRHRGSEFLDEHPAYRVFELAG